VTLEGHYESSPREVDSEKVAAIESSGGQDGTLHRGLPVIVLWTRGRRTGAVRKVPLMRVMHDGSYAVVASFGGSPTHPIWFHNLEEDPRVTVQDGPVRGDYLAHVATGDERALWWALAAAVFPDYDRYQVLVEREIPLVVLDPTRI